jgi:hypothetical protein
VDKRDFVSAPLKRAQWRRNSRLRMIASLTVPKAADVSTT